jgi:hypothetical protein
MMLAMGFVADKAHGLASIKVFAPLFSKSGLFLLWRTARGAQRRRVQRC